MKVCMLIIPSRKEHLGFNRGGIKAQQDLPENKLAHCSAQH